MEDVATMAMEDVATFLQEAARRYAAIPELADRLVRVPNPDQWLFNEATFRPMAERLVAEVVHLPKTSREGILGSPEYLYHSHMLRVPDGLGTAYRNAYESGTPFDARSECARRGGIRAPASPTDAADPPQKA